MYWQNLPLSAEELPTYKELTFLKVQHAFKSIMLIERAIYWAILMAVSGIIMFNVRLPLFWISLICLLLLFFLLLLMFTAIKSFYNMGYALREHDIVFRKGWLFENIYLIPLKKIQHISVKRGPLERANGLASLKLFTAGGVGADVTLSGLKHEDALQLKQWITDTQKPLQNPNEQANEPTASVE